MSDPAPTAPEISGAASRPAYRRAVFYVAGFDIVGPRYYHLLFKRGLKQDSGLAGRTFTMQEADAEAPAARAWRVSTSDGKTPVEVDYFILTPHDMIAGSYRRNALWIGRAWLVSLFHYLRYGVLARSLAYSWRNGVLLIYVFLLILGFFALGAGLAYVAFEAAWPQSRIELRLLAGLVAGLGVLQLGMRFEKRTFAGFLLSSMYMGLQQAAGRRPEIDAIIDGFARHVVAVATREKWDEILVVGHSSGTMMAIDVAAQIVDAVPQFRGACVSLLTLGSTDGVVSYYRHARRQRAALAAMATTPAATWIEYYSNRDWVCLGGRNPIMAAGIDLAGRTQRWPRMVRLSLKEFYTPQRLRDLPFNPFDRHFDYLRAGDRPSRYSYFRIVCAATALGATIERAAP